MDDQELPVINPIRAKLYFCSDSSLLNMKTRSHSMKNFRDKDSIDLKNSKDRDRMYKRFDEHQKAFFHSIKDHVFTFCEAITGSGKTTVATAALLDMLANGEIDKIVYIRVADDRAQSIGYYPGTLEEKTDIYWEPFLEALEELGLQREVVQLMKEHRQIETTLDVTMRGINIERAGVIIDEIQNADLNTLRLIFTRFHDDVHAAAIGDGKQCDQKKASEAYREYCEYLADSSLGNKCELIQDYRGKFSRLAEEYVPAKKQRDLK